MIMKKEIKMAYESPVAQEVLIQVEGLLCESLVNGNHDGYTKGGEIDF